MFKLTAVAGDGKVTLNWPSVAKAVKFRVRRGLVPAAATVIGVVTSTQLTDISVSNGQKYGYIVTAIDRRGNRIDQSTYEEVTPKSASPFGDLPELVGFGKIVSGGGDAIPQKVDTIDKFIEGVQDSGKRVLYGDRQWMFGAGQQINPGSGDLTIVGVSLGRLGINYKGVSNVRLHDYRSLPNLMDTPNTDGLTVNGQSDGGPVEGFAMSNGWSCGGPDMGGGAILGPVFNFTAQHWVFGPGLRQSVGSDERDHNRVLNFTTFGEHANGPYGSHQTTFECLVWGGEERNPDIKYVDYNEFVRCMVYNAKESPNGNPRGLYYAYNRIRTGPQSNTSRATVFETQVKPDEAIFGQSVFLEGNVADGFTYREKVDVNAKRTSPKWSPMVKADAAPEVEELLALVGPTAGLNAQEKKLLGFVRDRKDEGYYTGPGTGTPNLAWPTNP